MSLWTNKDKWLSVSEPRRPLNMLPPTQPGLWSERNVATEARKRTTAVDLSPLPPAFGYVRGQSATDYVRSTGKKNRKADNRLIWFYHRFFYPNLLNTAYLKHMVSHNQHTTHDWSLFSRILPPRFSIIHHQSFESAARIWTYIWPTFSTRK